MLPEPDKVYLFQKIKALAPDPSKDASQANGANDYVVWLKHGTGPDGKRLERATILEIEMYALVLRAISKFHAVYNDITPQMVQFWKEAYDHLSDGAVPAQP